MGLLFGCVCLLFGLFIGLLILSVIIRASVWITNKCLGESGGGYNRRSSYDDDWDDDYDDDYDRPRRRRRGGSGIPEPDLFKGMGIAFLVFLCQFAVGFVIGLVMGVGMAGAGGAGGGRNNPFNPQAGVNPAIQLASSCFQFIIGFLIWSGILTAMLPTSFGRASLVTVFIYIFLVILAVCIFIAAFAIGMAGAGGAGGFR